MNSKFLICIILCIVFLSSCNSSKEISKKPTLEGTWYVKEANVFASVIEPRKSLSISFDKNMASIKLDVNTCGTKIKVKKKTILFEDQIACTKACCEDALSLKIVSTLKGEFSYKFEGNNLVIFNDENSIVLSSEEEKKPTVLDAKILFENSYIITSYEDKNAGTSYQSEEKVIISFSGEGMTNLKLNVNNCSSTTVFNEKSIELMHLFACTKMCCDSENSNRIKNLLKGSFNVFESDNNSIKLVGTESSFELVKVNSKF
jgi:heat shock protein HslJ